MYTREFDSVGWRASIIPKNFYPPLHMRNGLTCDEQEILIRNLQELGRKFNEEGIEPVMFERDGQDITVETMINIVSGTTRNEQVMAQILGALEGGKKAENLFIGDQLIRARLLAQDKQTEASA